MKEANGLSVDYRSFNIANGETVRFLQPGSSSAILNRISGGASTIAGNLHANGNVYLINRSGILFSSSAQVDVHGLVASSMDLANSDFLSGNLEFSGSGGSVVNQGSLNGNFIYLVGGSVQNSGSISAAKVALAAGASSVKIDEAAGGDITLIIDGEIDVSAESGGTIAVAANRVAHSGTLRADGTTYAGGGIEVLSKELLVLSEDSIVSADAGTHGDGGRVILYTEGDALFPEGAEITARGGSESGDGGFVEVSGVRHIALTATPDVRARAETGKDGKILIDPTDITIDASSIGSGGSFNANPPFSYTPSAAISTISTMTLETLLDSGDVEISTASAFSAPNNGSISLVNQLTFRNTVDRTLTLRANNFIDLQAQIQPASTVSAGLNLVLESEQGILVRDNIDLAGGDFTGTANANSGSGDFNIDTAQILTFNGDINISGNGFSSDGAQIFGHDVHFDFRGDIDLDGTVSAQSHLGMDADGSITIQDGPFSGLFAVDGLALCADKDFDGNGNVLTTAGNVPLNTDGGPIFISGAGLDLSHASIQTPDFAPNIVSLVAQNFINLVNPDTSALIRGSDIYVQANATAFLSTPMVADNQVLVAATQINGVNHPAGPTVQANLAGFQALNNIGSATSPIQIDAPNFITQAPNGAVVAINNADPTPTEIDFAQSGDLSAQVPAPLAPKVTANIIIDNRPGGGGNNNNGGGGDSFPGGPHSPPTTGDPEPNDNTPGGESDPVVGITQPSANDVMPLRRTVPVSLLQENSPTRIPAFGTLARQRIERARAVPVIETPSAKVTAVQFAEFYFLHEKMQISDYANDLDLYFIDYLVFGVAEVTADPRIPVEVKGSIIHGGPRPFQL